MSDDATTSSEAELQRVRIFICSSGDMIAERQAALRVITAVNRAAHGAVQLDPYLWEEHAHLFQADRSYQGNIPLPAEFDIFLGFLFSRIGSRLTEEEYRHDILTRLEGFPVMDEAGAPDRMALTYLSAELPAEALPTGTTFEILNAHDAARSSNGERRPCLWLAINSAVPEGLTSLDPAVSGPVRQRRDDVSRFVADELAARHIPIIEYGADTPRARQEAPGGLQEFEDKLERWLTNTLATRFSVRLSWADRAYVGLRPFKSEEAPIFLGRRSAVGVALGRLDELAREGKPTFLLLTGPSGAGKSSFARAGLLGNLADYRLHRRRTEGALFDTDLVRSWRHVAARPAELGEDPAGALLSRIGGALGDPDGLATFAADLAALSFSEPSNTVPPLLAETL